MASNFLNLPLLILFETCFTQKRRSSHISETCFTQRGRPIATQNDLQEMVDGV